MIMRWLRSAASGPLSNKEIAELDKFLLDEESLDEAMDVCTLDGFLCAVPSGPKLIVPSEWMRWVWDMKGGKQAPEFKDERQARRIIELLMRHANDIALSLSPGSGNYEPLPEHGHVCQYCNSPISGRSKMELGAPTRPGPAGHRRQGLGGVLDFYYREAA